MQQVEQRKAVLGRGATDSTPICSAVGCGSTTVIEVPTSRVSAKKSQVIRAISGPYVDRSTRLRFAWSSAR